MGLARFPLNNYRGGWNLRDNPGEMAPNESPYTKDFTLTPLGQLTQRRGTTRWDPVENRLVGPVLNFRRWLVGRGETINVLMVSANGKVWSLSTTGVATRRFEGTAATVWDFEPSRDRAERDFLWMVNGTDAPQKWDGREAATVRWENPPPRECTILKSWKNRMFASGNPAFPQRLYAAPIANPEGRFDTSIDIGTVDDDLDPVMDINVLGDNLIVFKRNSVWVIYDDETLNNRRLGSPGCEGPFQSAELDNRLYYFSRRGICSVGIGGDVNTDDVDQIQPLFTGENSPTDVLNTEQASLTKARVATTPQGRVLISLAVNGEAENNRLLELIPKINFYHLGGRRYVVRDAIMRHVIPTAHIAQFNPNQTLISTRTSALLYTLFEGTKDFDERLITSQHILAWVGVQEEEPIERLRRVNIRFNGKITIDMFQEFNLNAPTYSQTLTAPTEADPLWDGGIWNEGAWDPTEASVYFGRIRPESRARYHAVGFRGADEAESQPGVGVLDAEIVYRGGKEH